MSDVPQSGSLATRLRSLTPARVGLGRTGVSLLTCDLLDFQRSHAQARDAVHARLEAAALAASLAQIANVEVVRLHSAAKDRAATFSAPILADGSRKPAGQPSPIWPNQLPANGTWP